MINLIMSDPVPCLFLVLCGFLAFPVFELVYKAIDPAPPKAQQRDLPSHKGGEP